MCAIITMFCCTNNQGGAYRWLNVKFVERALLSVLKSAIHTEDPTDAGSPTSER